MKKFVPVCSVLLLLSLLFSCATSRCKVEKMDDAPKHVLLIGFDGLSSYSLTYGAEMPVFRNLTYPEAELGFVYEWDGMRNLVDTSAINYLKPVALSAKDTKQAVTDVVSYIKEKKPLFCSVIFGEPDGAGHHYGWTSEQYYAMLTHLDLALAEIVKAIDEAGIADETMIILAADHGGTGKGHGGKTMEEMQTTIVFNGKGVRQGFVIPESTMVYDIAGTLAYIFGLERPQVWLARPIKSAFEN